MSRIGKKEITIPAKTEVTVDGGVVTVKGPLGELSRNLVPNVSIKVDDGVATVHPADNSIRSRALWGTYASHMINMVQGVNQKYVKELEVVGVGYRVELKGSTLVLNLGFSHPVEMAIPEDIEVAVEKNAITISGINKESVGQFAAEVRDKKRPEPYKGKGIRYKGERVRRKEGKKNV